MDEKIYTDEQINKMVKSVLKNEKLKNKMLKDFGFEVKEYEPQDLAYILYSITECGGLTNKVKAAMAIYIVDQIAKFSTQHNDYQSIGNFAMDLLKECGVINFKEIEG